MKHLLKVVFAFVFALLLLGGCNGSSGKNGKHLSIPEGRITYPVDTDVTLTYWMSLANNVAPNFAQMGDTPYAKAMAEKTGVNVRFLHPPSGGINEQFNLLVASGDMPDIMERNWLELYPGGPQKAIDDGVILRLNDIIEKHCPNLKALLAANPEWDRMVKTDKGDYYAFPMIREREIMCVWQGPMLRKDWLDELGLAMPETYDEWYTVLSAFKNQKGATAPLSMIPGNYDFLFGYGADSAFFIGDNGNVRWGGIEDSFRKYLTMMNKWYRDGIFDPDFATLTMQVVTAKITRGLAGASCGGVGGQMGTWNGIARASNPDYALIAAPYPVEKKGDKSKIINVDNMYTGAFSAAITTSCKNPVLAARMLDWNYSEEGNLFSNFGIEGVSYTVIDGGPVYTDLIMQNPNGWSVGQAIAAYSRASYGGPFVQNYAYHEQYLTLPEQQEAIRTWLIDDLFERKLPPVTVMPEESGVFARIMGEINPYAEEMQVKFILGTESLNDASWNAYVNNIKKMGIDRAVAIQSAALARYKSR